MSVGGASCNWAVATVRNASPSLTATAFATGLSRIPENCTVHMSALCGAQVPTQTSLSACGLGAGDPLKPIPAGSTPPSPSAWPSEPLSGPLSSETPSEPSPAPEVALTTTGKACFGRPASASTSPQRRQRAFKKSWNSLGKVLEGL